jgi:hypothetical protein
MPYRDGVTSSAPSTVVRGTPPRTGAPTILGRPSPEMAPSAVHLAVVPSGAGAPDPKGLGGERGTPSCLGSSGTIRPSAPRVVGMKGATPRTGARGLPAAAKGMSEPPSQTTDLSTSGAILPPKVQRGGPKGHASSVPPLAMSLRSGSAPSSRAPSPTQGQGEGRREEDHESNVSPSLLQAASNLSIGGICPVAPVSFSVNLVAALHATEADAPLDEEGTADELSTGSSD